MSLIRDVIDALGAVVEHLDTAVDRASVAGQLTGDAHQLAASVGAGQAVADLDEVRERVETLHTSVATLADAARETLALARGISGVNASPPALAADPGPAAVAGPTAGTERDRWACPRLDP